MIIKDSLIKEIHSTFNNGIPNGMLLGWDEERFYTELLNLSQNGKIVNATDFNYSFCNTYYFYYPPERSKVNEKATLQISFISNVFQIYWGKYLKHSSIERRIQEPEYAESKDWEKNVKAFMKQRGFEEFLDELYNLPIDGIELELSEKDEVTIGKCLFEE